MRRYSVAIIGILLLIGVVTPGCSVEGSTRAGGSSIVTSQVDATRPTIYGWGIWGHPEAMEPFDVWANVTDSESGVRNASLHVFGPNVSINVAMNFNVTSSLYEMNVSAFPNEGDFTIYIKAFDMANNSRQSSRMTITVSGDDDVTIDPNITMPIVVASSTAFALVVIGLAYIYSRRQFPV
ncbi:MAG: hypothetical protein ACP6KW_10940 [Candidatus Thorarchaeota archaeon]